MKYQTLHIDQKRMLGEIKKQGTIGWQEGVGLCREGYSEVYDEVREYVRGLMEAAGLAVRVDSVGNIFGCLPGSDPNAKTILVGSHLDSVYGGGIYDGQYGVFGALEAVRRIKESGIVPRHNIEVVGFISEEGGPLGGTFGSRCFCGLADSRSLSLEVKEHFGLTDLKIAEAGADLNNYLCFLEMHIEQGPVLDRDNEYKLGIPTGIVGILRYHCSITGEANHAGTTPMKERDDALARSFAALSEWIQKVADTDDVVCNVAQIKNEPDQIGVVSEHCEFVVEIRSQNRTRSGEAASWLEELLSQQKGSYTMEQIIDKAPVVLDESLINCIEKTTKMLGIASKRMPSGASHDAASLGKVMPTAMIFVPSRNGVSHNKEEYTKPEELSNGADVLCNTILCMDEEI